MELSEKIYNLRKANNLSQEQLAAKIDVSRQTISKWESGRSIPHGDKLIRLCSIFNVTLNYISTSSKVDEPYIKSKILDMEKRDLLDKQERSDNIVFCISSCIVTFLFGFAIVLIAHAMFWEFLSPAFALGVILVVIVIMLHIICKTIKLIKNSASKNKAVKKINEYDDNDGFRKKFNR